MEEEIDDTLIYSDGQEVFEIVDYTTASEWERFISAFEEILIDWKLVGDDANIVKLHLNSTNMPNVEWHEQTTTIKFADYCFNATHHYVSLEEKNPAIEVDEKVQIENKDEMPQYLLQTMNTDIDFASKTHCISRWYGVQQFIVLSASPTVEPLTSHTRAKLILSALAIAASNTHCQIPLFLQTRRQENKVFSGVAISNGLRTNFDMACLKQLSRKYTNLDGFLSILKEKIGLESYPRADVAAKFTYKLSLWPDTQWKQPVPDYDPFSLEFDFSQFIKLPFGTIDDPVSDMFVSTFNPTFHGDFDGPAEKFHRSRLNPSFLNEWSVRVTAPNYLGRTLIASIMRAFLDTSQNRSSIKQILGAEFDPLSEESDMGSALKKLTSNPVPFLAKVMSRKTFKSRHQPVRGPLCEEVLTQLLRFLFPDSCLDQTLRFQENFSQIPKWDREFDQMPEETPLRTVFSNMKSCAIDSFVWRLAIVSCYCIMSIGKTAIAQLIYEIYMELRFRWDNSLPVLGVDDGLPNLATCLFNQKMQMLNYCISRRSDSEGKCEGMRSEETKVYVQAGESEDEFFECNEDTDDVSDQDYLPEWDKPVGRLKRLNNERLLNSQAFLYIPITQDAQPVTEDRLEQQKDDLVRLGSDVNASHHRARMMSISLLSDMESFKAANPGCVLEDFVRWYSPRDWLKDENGVGHLSERMIAPGNLWKEVWGSAVPVPTSRQKRLFDETKESHSVLMWIGNLSPGTFCQELLPVLAHACLARIIEESIIYALPASISVLPMPLHCKTLFAQLELVAQRILRISRHCPPDLAMYEAVLEQLRAIEIDITRAKSLRMKILGYSGVTAATFNYSSFVVDSSENLENVGNVPVPSEAVDNSFQSSVPSSDFIEDILQPSKTVEDPSHYSVPLSEVAGNTLRYSAPSAFVENPFQPSVSSSEAIEDKLQSSEAFEELLQSSTKSHHSAEDDKNQTVSSAEDFVQPYDVHDPSQVSADSINLEAALNLSKEKILEKFVHNLLSNQEIPIDDSPRGPQSAAIIKLFHAGMKESEKTKDEKDVELSGSGERHFYDDPEHFFFGRPFAREYLIRAKGKFPSRFSRLLPQRMFFVVLPSEFRMSGAVTQDTLFC